MFIALKDILAQIHLFHLETETLSAHKTSDKLRAALDPLVDKYMELTLAGKVRKIKLDEGFELVHMSKQEFYQFLGSTVEFYKRLRAKANSPDIQTVLDEMINETNRAIYLLDFE